jgi:YfiH family protein
MNPDWLRPVWPAPAGVQAVFTTRLGGLSQGPYARLNVADHVGDDPQRVVANRASLQAALGVPTVFLDQQHGTDVLHLNSLTPNGRPADASLTQQRQLACTVMVADCLPLLLTTERGRAVAAVHLGWRGLARGLVQVAVQALSALDDAPVVAWLGPCIGPRAFQVGPEVRAAFMLQDAADGQHFLPDGGEKYLADLAALARDRLFACGVHSVSGNDSSPTWCTSANASRYFSFRRDGVCGRMAACVWLN